MRSVQRTYPFIVIAIFFVLIVLVRSRGWDEDEFEHMQFAWSVWKGAVPYREVFENHPPLYYLVVQPFFWLFGGTDQTLARFIPVFLRALSLLFTGASAVLTWMIARRGGCTANAAWLSALLLLGDGFFLAKGIEIRPDMLALFALLVTAYCVLAGLQSEPQRLPVWMGAAGMAGAVALLSTPKPLFGLAGLACAFLVNASGKFSGSVILRGVALALLGALVVAAPIVAWLASMGALHDFVAWNFTLVDRLPRFPDYRVKYAGQAVKHDLFLIVVATAGCGMLCKAWWRKRSDAFPPVVVIPLICLAAGAFLVPNLQRQYIILMVPFSALAGGFVLAPLIEARPPSILTAIVASLAMITLVGSAGANLNHQWQARGFNALNKLDFVLEHTTPDASVLWGWDPGIAFRKPAFFYTLNENFREIPSSAEYQALGDGIRSGTIRPSLVAFDDELLLLPAPVLAAIHTVYTPVGKFDLWRRKDGEGFISDPLPGSGRN